MKIITFSVSLNSLTSVICLLLFLFHSGCGRVYFPFKLESVSRSERDAGQSKPKIELLPLTQANAKKANNTEYTSLVRIKGANGLSSKLVPSSKAIIEKYPPYVDPGEYKIGENDILRITFINSGTLSEKSFPLLVRKDGLINLLNFGLINASGLTLGQLRDEIYERIIISEIPMLKDFDLTIQSFNSKKFFVNFKRMPYISSAIYLKDVLSTDAESLSSFLSSGGPITVGNVDTKINLGDLALINRDAEIRLIRDDVTYKISAVNLFKKRGDVVRILPEDQFVIEPLNYFGEDVLLIGETGAQVKIPINSVQIPVLSDIVFSGRSLNSLSSDISQIYLLREKRKQEFVAYHLDITNPARAKLASSIEMRPRDIVFVAAQPLTLYNRVLSQILTSVNLSQASLTAVSGN